MSLDLVRQRLAGFESVRTITIASLEPLAQAQMDFRERDDRWSIGQTADHLLKSESLYRTEIERLVALARDGKTPRSRYTFADIDVRPLGLPVSVLTRFEKPLSAISRNLPDGVRSYLTLNPVVPARNPGIAEPANRRPVPGLIDDLQAAIAMTRAVILDNVDLPLDEMRVEHPLTGITNVSDILLFLARHETRHQGQMETVRRDSRFPGRPDAA